MTGEVRWEVISTFGCRRSPSVIHKMENRRLMSTAWRQANPRVSWLHYLMPIACDGARKAGDFRCLHQRKTRKQGNKEKPHHSNHFQLNCLLSSQSNPLGAFLFTCFLLSWEQCSTFIPALGESFLLNNNQCFLQSLLSQPHIQHPQVPRALGDNYRLSHQWIASRQ